MFHACEDGPGFRHCVGAARTVCVCVRVKASRAL